MKIKPSITVREIDNGFLVTLNAGMEQREISCKSMAQVLKAIKELLNADIEMEEEAPTPKVKLGKKG